MGDGDDIPIQSTVGKFQRLLKYAPIFRSIDLLIQLLLRHRGRQIDTGTAGPAGPAGNAATATGTTTAAANGTGA